MLLVERRCSDGCQRNVPALVGHRPVLRGAGEAADPVDFTEVISDGRELDPTTRDVRSTNITLLEAHSRRSMESIPIEESQPRLHSSDGRQLTVSTETTSDAREEEAPEHSPASELTASPWVGLHYKDEH